MPDIQQLFCEGLNLAREGENERALACFDRIIEADPGHIRARYNKGVCLMLLKRYRESVLIFRELIPDCPGDADIYNNMGKILVRTGQQDKAAVCFEKTLKIDPRHADAMVQLGIVRGRVNSDIPGAMEMFEKALALNSELAEAHQGLGICHHHLGDYAKAVAHLGQALKCDSNNAAVHNHLGIMFKKLGNNEEAEKHFQEALRINPEARFRHENLWQMND